MKYLTLLSLTNFDSLEIMFPCVMSPYGPYVYRKLVSALPTQMVDTNNQYKQSLRHGFEGIYLHNLDGPCSRRVRVLEC